MISEKSKTPRPIQSNWTSASWRGGFEYWSIRAIIAKPKPLSSTMQGRITGSAHGVLNLITR